MDNQCLTETNTGVPFYDSVGGQIYSDNGQLVPLYLEPCQTIVSPTLEWLFSFLVLAWLFFTVVRFIIKYVGKLL